MKKDDGIRIKHMKDACNEILAITAQQTVDDLLENRLLTLSIVKLLEIIGEAANHVTKETIDSFKKIPWKDIIAMRHRLIHGYFDIDVKIVWRTVEQDIPDLAHLLSEIVDQENRE